MASTADDRHHFRITVELRGPAGADWSGVLETQEVRAYNLRDALEAAAALPLGAWFPDLDDVDESPRWRRWLP